MDCIDQTRFAEKMEAIKAGYLQLINLRDRFRPRTPIFTHAYDFAVPSGRPIYLLGIPIGPWIKNMETQKGITHSLLQQQIVTYMLSTFASIQEELEREHKGIVYVRTQGTLDPKTDWGDELHPTAGGFKKIASKFQAALRSVFPGLPQA